MKRIISFLLSLTVVMSMSAFTCGAVETEAPDTSSEDVIVVFNSSDSEKIADMSESQAEGFLDMDSDIEIEKIENLGTYQEGTGKDEKDVHISAAVLSSDSMTAKEMINEAYESDAVKYAVPNIKVHMDSVSEDTYSDKQWGLQRTNVSHLWDMNSEYTGTDKVVAVIDSGVDYTHPDLSSNMWNNPYQASLKGKYGYDFVNEDSDPMDDQGHGTHCAGIIGGAGNNGIGITGMCQHVKIMALKVLDSKGYGELEDIIGAYSYINKAQELGIDIVAVNDSWSYRIDDEDAEMFYEQSELDALKEVFTELMNAAGSKGALSICAAGNSGVDIDHTYIVPAGCDSDYQITVSAVDNDGSQAYYSNYGSSKVDIAAPGTDILSTVSYEGFDVNLLSDEQKKAAVNYTEDFEGDVDLGGIMYFNDKNRRGIPVSEAEDCTCSITEEKSSEGKKSLKLAVDDIYADEVCAFAIPMELNGQKKPYVEFKANAVSCNGNEQGYVYFSEGKGNLTLSKICSAEVIDYTLAAGKIAKWDNVTGRLSGQGTEPEYLIVMFNPLTAGAFEVCIDNFVMTNTPTDQIEEMKVKYDTYSGTSMAAPHVTGAAAIVENYLSSIVEKGMDKGEMAIAVKSAILNNAAKSSAAVKYGELDLSRISVCPVISSMKAEADRLIISGRNFSPDTKVIINGKVIDKLSISSNEKTIVIPKNYRNHKIAVEIKNAFGKVEKNKLMLYDKIKVSEVDCDFAEMYGSEDNALLFSDGRKLYSMYDESGALTISMYEGGAMYPFNFCVNIFGKKEYRNCTPVTKPVVANGRVYVIVAGSGSDEAVKAGNEYYEYDSSFECEYRLVSMSLNPDEAGMFESIKLPSSYSNIEGEALGSYNGNIYLLGGYDYAREKTSRLVYKYTVSTGKWSKPSCAQLPYGRYGGSAVQSGSKLYYAMGASDTGKMPRLLKYNGSGWVQSSVQLNSDDYTAIKVGESKLNYYNGSVCLIESGILMNGVFVNGYGDSIKYVSSKYAPSRYNFRTGKAEKYNSAAVGKYVYLLGTKGENIKLYRGTYTSGMVKATGTYKHGKVLNSGRLYLPGTRVKYTAKPSKGYKKKSFYVDGKKVSGSVKTVVLKKNIKIKAVFEKKSKKK